VFKIISNTTRVRERLSLCDILLEHYDISVPMQNIFRNIITKYRKTISSILKCVWFSFHVIRSHKAGASWHCDPVGHHVAGLHRTGGPVRTEDSQPGGRIKYAPSRGGSDHRHLRRNNT
jgi:hypothetical protein